jgi:hypothetical protein
VGKDHEKELELELDLVLGSNQGMTVCKKDSGGMATVEPDHSAKVVVSTDQCHE